MNQAPTNNCLQIISLSYLYISKGGLDESSPYESFHSVIYIFHKVGLINQTPTFMKKDVFCYFKIFIALSMSETSRITAAVPAFLVIVP
jgi:hypothetical protein